MHNICDTIAYPALDPKRRGKEGGKRGGGGGKRRRRRGEEEEGGRYRDRERMAGGGFGPPKVSLGLAMPYRSTPCRQATPAGRVECGHQ
jgi:hypothetical protein